MTAALSCSAFQVHARSTAAAARARAPGNFAGADLSAASLRGQRNIGDFTRWQEPDAYGKALERLLGDRTVETARESSSLG